MKLNLAFLALAILPLAACEKPLPEEVEPVKPRPPAVSPLVAPIETNAAEQKLAVNADAETLNVTAFAARGNEPNWTVSVSGNTAVYSTDPNQGGRKVTVDRLVFAQGVEYVGTLDGLVFAANFRGADCTDSSTAEKFPLTATITVRGKTYRGCAVPATPAESAS